MSLIKKKQNEKMTKKGELSINVIIIAILALVVLVTLVIIFNQQISGLFGSFSSLSKDTTELANNLPDKIFGETPEGTQTNTPTT